MLAGWCTPDHEKSYGKIALATIFDAYTNETRHFVRDGAHALRRIKP